MKLGILVNSDKHLDDVVGIVNSAASKGHEVSLFTMEKGINLFAHDAYKGLCSVQGVSMSYCDHSAKMEGLDKDGMPEAIVCGSQFDNANMMHDVDKVITL